MQSRNWAYSTHPTELRALLCESLWAGLSMFERYRKQFAKTAVQHSLTPHSSYVSVHGRSQQATPPWPAVLSLRTVNRREALWTTRTKRALSHRLPITLLGVHPVVVRRINMDLALVLGCCLPSSCCAVRVATLGTEHHRAAFAPTLMGWLFSYPSRQKHCSAFPFWLSYLQLQLVSFRVL